MALGTTTSKPSFAQRDDPLKIVIEGVGDVIRRYYEPAFKAVINKFSSKRKLHVTFVDKSEFWKPNPNLSAKMQDNIKSLQTWIDSYVDKSDPVDLKTYQQLKPDIVIIATPAKSHIEIAEEWVGRSPQPEQIFIEKPLDVSLNAVRKLLGKLEPFDDRVLTFDHYRARFLPDEIQMKGIYDHLGIAYRKSSQRVGGLRHFTFYFLEDHSGSDLNYHPIGRQRDGALENEGRVEGFNLGNEGLILDAMPHIIAILDRFCRVETVRVTRVRAGQYVGVDGDPNKRTEIERETFAEVRWECSDMHNNRVNCEAYVGKGILGVQILGSNYNHNVKWLELEGLNGRKVIFDLRSSGSGASKGYLTDEHGLQGRVHFEFSLNTKPYEILLEKIIEGTYLQERLAFHVEVGKRMLEVMGDMTFPIPDKDKIATYESGMSSGRASQYMENIVNNLPILWGR